VPHHPASRRHRACRRGVGLAAALLGLGLVIHALPAAAGDLNPSGPPAPTMKTLDQIPPSWDQALPSDRRFRLVLPAVSPGCVNDPPIDVCLPVPQGVLDLETGLVWDRFPGATPVAWPDAVAACNASDAGGRGGWRLPAVEELRSLVDPSVAAPGPTLPAGHPFVGVPVSDPSPVYWSATTVAGRADLAWGVELNGGTVRDGGKQGLGRLVWCVRGGRGHGGG